MSSLDHRIAYLGLADFDYLAARILLRNGLIIPGLPRATEAFEKILKLLLILEARISRKEEIQAKDLRAYGHDLVKLFTTLNERLPVPMPDAFGSYFAMLRDAYDRRYPEHWKSFTVEVNVDYLDGVYAQLRNNAVINFPVEERPRARSFGTFITDAYSPSIRAQIAAIGGESIGALLRSHNSAFDSFDIDKALLP